MNRLLALALLLPLAAPAWELETGIVAVTGTTTVTFAQAFPSIPVVVPLADTLQSQPVQVRVSNVSATGFTLTPVRPSGLHAVAPLTVHFIAAEVGEHQYPDGTRLAAGHLSSSQLLPASGASAWQSVAFATAFAAAPAVLSAPQTSANGSLGAGTVTPWLVGTARNASASGFQLALDGGSVYGGTLGNAETLGWIAQTPGSGSFLPADGTLAVSFAAVGPASGIQGPDDNPDGNLLTPFPTDCASLAVGFAPVIALAGKTSRNDAGGGWLRRCSATVAANAIPLTFDEELSGLPLARRNTVDTASAIAFSRSFHASFGLMADYHLDECTLGLSGSSAADSAPYGLTATTEALSRLSVTGAASPGPLCQAAGFGSSSSRLYTPVSSDTHLDIRAQLSLAAWLRHDGSADNAQSSELKTVLAKGNNTYRLALEKVCVATPSVGPAIVDPASALLGCADGLLVTRRWAWLGRLEIFNGLTGVGPPFVVRSAPVGQGALWEPAGEVLAGNWTHLAASYDGLQLKLYLDGVLRGTVSTGGSVIPINGNSQPLTAGVTVDASSARSSRFTGALDELAVWNLPLSLTSLDSQHRLRSRSCGRCGRQVIYLRETYAR